MGSAAYAPERDAMVWKIKSFPGGKVSAELIPTYHFAFHFCAMSINSNFLESLH